MALIPRAALLFVDFARGNPPCPKGNKKIAFVLMRLLLELNGFTVRGPGPSSTDLVAAVSDSSLTDDAARAQVESWLSDHIKFVGAA